MKYFHLIKILKKNKDKFQLLRCCRSKQKRSLQNDYNDFRFNKEVFSNNLTLSHCVTNLGWQGAKYAYRLCYIRIV